ncbi:MAG TPA: SurA N-terminal domain-containing protein [Pseudomonadales bacterium]|nr:SurA N-terminal domain-containing protein [Pseudomonadales bacterium]
MLELIREKMQGTFATIIVVLLCSVFAMWGVERLFDRGGKTRAAVTVNGEDITEPEVARATQAMRQRYVEMLGGKVDSTFLSDQMLREPALDSIISRKLLAEKTAKMKMIIGPTTIDREIVGDSMFSKDGKSFDPELFKEKLRSAGMTPTMYRQQLSAQMELSQLHEAIAGTAFVTERQVEAAAVLAAQTRSFEYIQFPLQAAMDGITPTSEAVEQYFKDHNNEFTTEEKVSIEYLDLNKANLVKDIKLEESDIRASYDQEVAAFKPSTERRAAHILIEVKPDGSEQAVLEQIKKRLAAGESFAALAKQFSSDKESAKEGGDVGFSSGNVFVPEFEQALAGLANKGDVSAPVKTEFGYHIIKLLDKRDAALPSFEERKPEIEKQLRQAKVGAIYAEKLDQMTESTYSAGDLAGPASELKMDVQKTAAFGRRGGVGVAAQQKVIDAAFSGDLLDSGKNSQVIELSADRAIVLRVSNHEISKPRELADVTAEIVKIIKHDQAVIALKAKAESIKNRVQSGTPMSVIGSEEKITPVSLASKNRNAQGVDTSLTAAAFKLAKPAANVVAADAIQLANGDWAVLHLVTVSDIQVGKDSEEYKAARQKLDSAVGNEDFSLYEKDLKESAKIIRKDAAGDTKNKES